MTKHPCGCTTGIRPLSLCREHVEVHNELLQKLDNDLEQRIIRDAASFEIKAIKGCARCGGEHLIVKAHELTRAFSPPEAGGIVWTHWFPCPATGEPVLVIRDAADDGGLFVPPAAS